MLPTRVTILTKPNTTGKIREFIEKLEQNSEGERQKQKSALPGYANHLQAFHRAFVLEIIEMIDGLDCSPQDKILDVPCGDGFYSICFSKLLGPGATIVAADTSIPYLHRVSKQAEQYEVNADLHLYNADIYNLPFEDGCFDIIWCAHSLISLDQPVPALQELRRVLRKGGKVAVLEEDKYHHMLLPWPVDLELAILQAVRDASQHLYGDPFRLCPGRYLRPLFDAAGFQCYRKKSFALDRQAPLSETDYLYLQYYLESLWSLIRDYVNSTIAADLQTYINPDSPRYLPNQSDFEMTCLNVISFGSDLE